MVHSACTVINRKKLESNHLVYRNSYSLKKIPACETTMSLGAVWLEGIGGNGKEWTCFPLFCFTFHERNPFL